MAKENIIRNLAKSNSLIRDWFSKAVEFMVEPRPCRPPGTWSWFAVSDELWFEILRDQERWYVRQQLEEMKKKKFLEKQQEGGAIDYKLTEQGKALVLQNMICDTKNGLPSNMQCYVIFDIPEPARDTRQIFRRFLKRCNFEMVQQSVWSSKNNVSSLLKELINLVGLDKWVKVIVGNQV